jgi:hypothetical protein
LKLFSPIQLIVVEKSYTLIDVFPLRVVDIIDGIENVDAISTCPQDDDVLSHNFAL